MSDPSVPAPAPSDPSTKPLDGGLINAGSGVPSIPLDLIQGGTADFRKPSIEINAAERRERTTTSLATALLCILGFTILLQYGSVALVLRSYPSISGDVALTTLKDLFTTCLPVISGLAGSACTYYFTKQSADSTTKK